MHCQKSVLFKKCYSRILCRQICLYQCSLDLLSLLTKWPVFLQNVSGKLAILNTNVTAILCMVWLEHSKLKIYGHYNQICQCVAIKTEDHIFLECPSIYTSRQMLIPNVSKIFVEENIFSHSESATLNRTELMKILLFGYFCQSTKPFNITSPSAMFSVRIVFHVYVCASLFMLTFALPMTSSALGLPSLAVY